MIVRILKFFVVFVIFLTACASSGVTTPSAPAELPSEDAPLGILEHNAIYLKSTNLTSLPDGSLSAYLVDQFISFVSDSDETENCHLGSLEVNEDGLCLTPLNMSGKASSISLGSTEYDENSTGPARLFGATVGGISFDRYGSLEVYHFDFAEPVAMQGESNLYEANNDKIWNMVTVYMAYIDVQAKMKDKFWTVRFAFVPQKPALNDTIRECVDEYYLSAIAENGSVLDSETNDDFESGDLMVCIKDSLDETCEDADFQWLDLDSETFVDTRPANPLQHDWAGQNEVSCSIPDYGYEVSIGGYDLFADTTAFNFSSDLEGCQQVYSYTDPQTGAVTSGNTLTAVFDYDMESAVFIDLMDGNLEAVSDAALLQAFKLKQIYLRSLQEMPEATSGDPYLSVTAEISVSDDDSISCGSAGDVPDELLTGVDCVPDAEVKASCSHATCSPGFTAIENSIWSVDSSEVGNECATYCTKQGCDEYNGTVKNIYCTPECD